MTTKFSGTVRILLALSIVAFAGWFGYQHRNPWIIPVLAAMFTPLYVSGKWSQWKRAWKQGGAKSIGQALIGTVPVQLVLAALFYLTGLGIGKLATAREVHPVVTQSDLVTVLGFFVISLVLSVLVIVDESRAGRLDDRDSEGGSEANSEQEMQIDPERVTKANFFHARHGSVRDYTQQALAVDAMGSDDVLLRKPLGARIGLIQDTEARLGFKLPTGLVELYQQQNGGALPVYWVAKVESPAGRYEDWDDAFAHDYDDLAPLESLRTLNSVYMEYFDPEYDDIEDQKSWYPGSENTIVLAQRYTYGTLLDYNKGNSPEVVIFDTERPQGEQVRNRFESFDAFFSALRREKKQFRSPEKLVDGSPQDACADQFWSANNHGASSITERDWQAAERRLKVELPTALKPYYFALNGGSTIYKAHTALGADKHGRPRSPFLGAYEYGTLQPLEKWLSLEDLSKRLQFTDGCPPWAELIDGANKLIVISASFESALMLDYRKVEQPSVVYAAELCEPEGWVNLGQAGLFLTGLRRTSRVNGAVNGFMGDDSLSALSATPKTFWLSENSNQGASDEELLALEKNFDFELPGKLRECLQARNGGEVRFQYLPPEWPNDYGYVNPHSDQKAWVSLFPGGIKPTQQWCWFRDWREENGLAVGQELSDLMPAMASAVDVVEKLVVVGELSADGKCLLTLLDISTSYFKRSTDFLLIEYEKLDDQFRVAIQPKSLTHYTHGVVSSLRAKK